MPPPGRDAEATEPGASVCAVTPAGADRRLVLTYDDGPDPAGTAAVLQVLADHQVTATFFVLLSRTRRYPGLLAETMAAGHEIGLHGPDHQRLTRLDPAEVARRTVAARHELEDAAGRPVRWFRPPYGAQSAPVWQATRDAGLTPVLWTFDLQDWRDLPLAERLAPAREMTGPGPVVLAHDAFAGPGDGADDGPPPSRLDRGALCRELIGLATAQGYRCGSLGEALAAAGPRVQLWIHDD
jgi:peptidoglycan/xylan/chitin deacetylase (PgdA/CDA1 family)